jgi:hypothetical protein
MTNKKNLMGLEKIESDRYGEQDSAQSFNPAWSLNIRELGRSGHEMA